METKIKTYDDLHATQEFIHFIDTAIAAKNEGKSLTNYCWVGGRPTT